MNGPGHDSSTASTIAYGFAAVLVSMLAPISQGCGSGTGPASTQGRKDASAGGGAAPSIWDPEQDYGAPAIEAPEESGIGDAIKSFIKSAGYVKYGSGMYAESLGYPVPEAGDGSTPAVPAVAAPSTIRLVDGAAPNTGADSSGWVPVPAGTGHYWRAEYHLHDLDIADPYASFERRTADNYDDKKISFMKQSAKIQAASFPIATYRPAYYPGRILLKQSADGLKLGFFKHGDVMNPKAKWFYYKSFVVEEQEQRRIVALLNGTYYQEDNKYVLDGQLRYGGLVVRSKTVIPPVPQLATIAFYKDGSVRIGSYSNLPDHDAIACLRQNDLTVLENGKPGPGADPLKFFRFQDNMVRSYLAMTPGRDQIAYVWTNNTAVEALAEVLRAWGFSDVMLLDIHAVIAARVSNPGGPAGDFWPNSHDFVPRPSIFGTNFQWNPVNAIKNGSNRDFFAIFDRSP